MHNRRQDARVIFTIVLTVGSMLLPFYLFSPALADSKNEGVFAVDSNPYGVSHEDWSIKFWQWLISIPLDISPMSDTTGERCGEGQGSLPVFFLAGAGGGYAERTCTVSSEKAILIGVSAVECSYAELSGETEEELHTCAEEDQSSNPILLLSVDGREFKELESYRVHSRAFDVTFPDNAIFGAEPGPSRAVSDGYWVILEPLPAGEHEIHTKNSLTDPKTGVLFFSEEIKYHLIVTEPEDNHSISLQGTSTSGNYDVLVNWTSADIGEDNTFLITVMTPTGEILGDTSYDVMLFRGNEHLDETHRSNQKNMEQKYRFDEPGSYTLRIENINGSGETDSVTFPMQVTPEFPAGLSILFAGLVAVMSLAMARSRKMYSLR